MSVDTVVNLGGDEAAAELVAALWAVDCQSCGRPLGTKPPALAVNDLTVFAWASRTTRDAGHRDGTAARSSPSRPGSRTGPG